MFIKVTEGLTITPSVASLLQLYFSHVSASKYILAALQLLNCYMKSIKLIRKKDCGNISIFGTFQPLAALFFFTDGGENDLNKGSN